MANQKNATEQLTDAAAELLDEVSELMSRSTVHDLNRNSGAVVFAGPDHAWGALDVDGRRLQARALENTKRLIDTLRSLLRGMTGDGWRAFDYSEMRLREVVEQFDSTWVKSPEEGLEQAREAIGDFLELLAGLPDPAEGSVIYLPDTNSLLHNPHLDDWRFPAVEAFEILLTPTVLSELDELKVNHRNEDVRRKAEGLIRRMVGFRNRGSLTAGVPLRRGVSTIRSLAPEPRMDESLPWLDANNRDDRILASLVEVIRQHPRSTVTLVTRDLNLQNKAEFARLPFTEPPDPT